MTPWSCVIYSLALCVFATIVSASEWTVNLDYSLSNGDSWSSLGVIVLKRSFDGNYTGSYKSTTTDNLGVRLSEAQSNMYQVRGKSSIQPNKEFLSSTSPCLILQSRLFHVFWVSVDGERQVVQSLTVFPDSVAAEGQLDSQHCTANPQVKGEPKAIVHVQNKAVLPR
ncbi:hypothetical protein WR25_25842 [Diploscapter pachys]|uniref:DOMON domain-containing protein n=1 Tax=Diploscapter pachys TaxID=2018661 RepID=A0A2A2JME3_9BILA|nr:hypothetical protein WR25_25842 [Diploscapter pachys]